MTIIDPKYSIPPLYDQAMQDALMERWRMTSSTPMNTIYDPNPLPSTPKIEIDNVFYFKHIYKIQLLHQIGAITIKEVGRLVSMLDSVDLENWTMAEECIKQKFSEL